MWVCVVRRMAKEDEMISRHENLLHSLHKDHTFSCYHDLLSLKGTKKKITATHVEVSRSISSLRVPLRLKSIVLWELSKFRDVNNSGAILRAEKACNSESVISTPAEGIGTYQGRKAL